MGHVVFVSGFFHRASCFQGSSMLWQVSERRPRLQVNSAPVSGQTVSSVNPASRGCTFGLFPHFGFVSNAV